MYKRILTCILTAYFLMQTSCSLIVLGAGYFTTRRGAQTETKTENNLETKCFHDKENNKGTVSNEREVTKDL
jgi:hypothetical protein